MLNELELEQPVLQQAGMIIDHDSIVKIARIVFWELWPHIKDFKKRILFFTVKVESFKFVFEKFLGPDPHTSTV